MTDKLQAIKNFKNIYAGEIREVYGFWELIRAPMPNSWDNAWYHRLGIRR